MKNPVIIDYNNNNKNNSRRRVIIIINDKNYNDKMNGRNLPRF